MIYILKIYCKNHKEFFYQKAISHSSGHGCPQCNWDFSNFRKSNWVKKAKNKEGVFYIIKCWNKNEEFFKFGITFNSVKNRYKSEKEMPYNFEIVKEVKSYDLEYIWKLEKRFGRFKKKQHYKPLIKFGGYKRECFKN